jgi:hypothetical protein
MFGFLKNVGGMVRGDEIQNIKTSSKKKESKTTNGANR